MHRGEGLLVQELTAQCLHFNSSHVVSAATNAVQYSHALPGHSASRKELFPHCAAIELA